MPEATECPATGEAPVEATPAPTENPIDTSKDASHSPAFVTGYAEVLKSDAEVMPDEGERFLLPKGAVVYVSGREINHLTVWVDTQRGPLSGWTVGENLRPMSEAESAAFVEGERSREDVCFADDDKTLPLAIVEAGFPDSENVNIAPGEDVDGENALPIEKPSEEGAGTQPPEEEPKVSIALESSELTVRAGDSFALVPVFSDGNLYGYTVQISDESVLKAADGGNFEALAAGEAVLTFVSEHGEAACSVTVQAVPESVTLPYSTLNIGVGETLRLEPDVGGAVTQLRYASSKAKYVTVSSDGVIKGVRKGTAVVGVRTDNGCEAYVTVKVSKAPSKVTASPAGLVLGAGETAKIGYALPKNTAGSVRFASSDEGIAIVDPVTGEVTAVAPGKAKIRVQTYNKKNAYVTVEVKNAPESVSISPDALTIGVGQIVSLSASVNSGAAGAVEFSSADENLLAVSGNRVRGMAEGTTEILATSYNGAEGRATVTILPAPEKVTLPYKTLAVGVGEYVQLEPDCGDTAGGFSYESSRTKYVKVNGSGLIYAAKRGTSTVTVRTYNGMEASVVVKVVKAPSKVTASPAAMVLGVGETAVVGYALSKGAAGSVTFASSDESIAAVDPKTGEVTAVMPGKATVRIQTYNKKNAYVAVEVKSAPESVSISPEALTIGVGQIASLSAAVNSGAAGKVVIASSDENLLAVSGNRIKGLAAGETEVLATSYNGVVGRMAVRVVPAPEKVSLPYKTLNIGVGEYVQLEPEAGEGITQFAYKSKNTKYVQVNANGVIRGVRKGSARVYVGTYNGKETYVTVKVCTAPKAVKASASKLELGVGQSHVILHALPSGSAGAVVYSSSDPQIASVNETSGEVKALSPGDAVITLRTYNGKTAECRVRVYSAPDGISLGVQSLDMGVGQTIGLDPVLPEGSFTALTYTTTDAGVASVSQSGEITAKGMGTAVVRVQTHVPEVFAEVQIAVGDAPSGVTVAQNQLRLLAGETFRIEPIIPEGSKSTFTFASSNPEVASVAADGTVTAHRVGKARLAVSTYNEKTALIELTVWSPSCPEKITLHNQPDVLNLSDGSYALEYSVKPEEAAGNVLWESTNPGVATVDASGVIRLHGYGYAVISAVSAVDSAVAVRFTLTVQAENLALTIPRRTTQEDGIAANLALIDNIRSSAIAQVNALEKGGVITSADASKRRSIINNIFEDYAFPWKTPAYQIYWNEANSEGGVKDFKPDRVYYGLPYISGGSGNRLYNKAKALSQQRYVDTGKGYYMLNRNKLLNGKYVGNDCSALVDAAIWGTNSSHSNDRTADIAVSSAYKTIGNTAALRPGDLICKGKSHVVMFLYYANAEKTKIMIIENGGEEAGTNTVHCAVHDLSYYVERGYKGRRLSSLG